MPILSNIPRGITSQEHKALKILVDKIVQQDNIIIKDVDISFGQSKIVDYTDTAITQQSVVTAIILDETVKQSCNIDFVIWCSSHKITFTCDTIPQESVKVRLRIVNL